MVALEKTRAEWGGKLEFILTCVGYAVGLGNVWRFPYLCYKNGGGAFLIPYFTMLILVGLPIFFLELSFGQFANLGPIAIWKVSPAMKGLGISMVLVDLFVAFYYNVIIAWCIYYLIASMSFKLPWSSCDNGWNTNSCIEPNLLENQTSLNTTLIYRNMTIKQIKTPSEEFFYNKVLKMTDGMENLGRVDWLLLLYLFLAWAIVFLVLNKGIETLGKVVYFTSTFPYILLTAMLVRGVTLDGALEGIIFYLKPDFSKLTQASVWGDAAVQIFYSLSTCTGGLIAMASYNKFNNNCLRDALLVPFINCATSFYAGFVIFSVLGFMAKQKGVSVAEVAASGPGLVFVVYPEGLTKMPVAPLWSILFFFMMLNLGFSSEFSMVECVLTSIIDEFPKLTGRKETIFRLVACSGFLIIGIPFVTHGGFYVFNLVDNFVGGFPLLIVGLFETIVLMYVYGYNNFAYDIELMIGKEPSIFFKYTWKIITPLLLFAIIVFQAIQFEPLVLFETYIYPEWSMSIGWGIVAFILMFIPLFFGLQLFKEGVVQLLKKVLKASHKWGPAHIEDRRGRYMSDSIRSDNYSNHETIITIPNFAFEPTSENSEIQNNL